MHVLCLGGNYSALGEAHGEKLSAAINTNLKYFWAACKCKGYSQEDLIRLARLRENDFTSYRLEEIYGIAKGAKREYPELLAYNLYHQVIFPDECTVWMAIGKASSTGATLFAKNSDKIGDSSLSGPNFHQYKEINIVVIYRPDGGNAIIGVGAAGLTGLKMGLNDKGVACGTNIARTIELTQRSVDLSGLRAIDRGQLARIGLEENNASAAAQRIASMLIENPTSTPGCIEFADANMGVIVEGSYDRVAIEKVQDDIAARANAFIVLKELNDPTNMSSFCRHLRAQQLLAPHKGKVTPELMIAISMDHGNGPGMNSICRHSDDYRDETSLSTAVMEINLDQSERSKIHIALGKPCHAWHSPGGHITLDMQAKEKEIPESFLNGEAFKNNYVEIPKI
ncbi:MAG: C45 family autoproteolytic acyltransferase/hydrolase [bacterium]